MDWDAVKNDTYYRGRKLESDARNDSDMDKWEEYAELKILKGSHTLGINGYMNAAALSEAGKDIDTAVSYYEKALSTAIRVKYKDLVVILGYKIALLHEKRKEWDKCIAVYEQVAEFCDMQGEHFLAADAYEHAAEMTVMSGKDAADYTKPIDLWERNIVHWEEEDHLHDAVWSKEHIELYKKMIGIKK
ncbi:hypothetical protein [Desulfobacula sp.]|uniref:hypothetical protein n=1 Tax=Desulfobacula sp. TaxID=2593537 RepID=UPI002603A75E|nr:hypothetical protein [Desulfobacula sp.]